MLAIFVNNTIYKLNNPRNESSDFFQAILILIISAFCLYMVVDILYICYNLCTYHGKRLYE